MNMHIVKNTKSPNKRKKKTIITLILTGIGQSVSAKEITAIPIGLFRLMSMPNMDLDLNTIPIIKDPKKIMETTNGIPQMYKMEANPHKATIQKSNPKVPKGSPRYEDAC